MLILYYFYSNYFKLYKSRYSNYRNIEGTWNICDEMNGSCGGTMLISELDGHNMRTITIKGLAKSNNPFVSGVYKEYDFRTDFVMNGVPYMEKRWKNVKNGKEYSYDLYSELPGIIYINDVETHASIIYGT